MDDHLILVWSHFKRGKLGMDKSLNNGAFFGELSNIDLKITGAMFC